MQTKCKIFPNNVYKGKSHFRYTEHIDLINNPTLLKFNVSRGLMNIINIIKFQQDPCKCSFYRVDKLSSLQVNGNFKGP